MDFKWSSPLIQVHRLNFLFSNLFFQSKGELINTAKAIAANGKAIHRFAVIISKNCVDARFSQDLMAEADQIPVLSTQVS